MMKLVISLIIVLLFWVSVTDAFYNEVPDNIKSRIENMNWWKELWLWAEKAINRIAIKESNKFKTSLIKTEDWDILRIENPYKMLDKYWKDFVLYIRSLVIEEISKKRPSVLVQDWDLLNIKAINNWELVYWKEMKSTTRDNILKQSLFDWIYDLELWKDFWYIDPTREKIHDIILSMFNKEISINIDHVILWLQWWKKVNMFKNNKELQIWIDRWFFELASFRERLNVDKAYRLKNIKTAFEKAWDLVVINSWEKFDFIWSIDYDEYSDKKNYLDWISIVWWKETKTYWGWLCWASTAIYQWVMTNKNIKITNRKPHSWWSTNLYKANINWDYITTPWWDATVYTQFINWKTVATLNLEFVNTWSLPLFLVNKILERDWEFYEQNFTIWQRWSKWSLEFVKKNWKCYTWKINWEEKTSCYKLINK